MVEYSRRMYFVNQSLFTSGFTMRDSSPLACALNLIFTGLKELDSALTPRSHYSPDFIYVSQRIARAKEPSASQVIIMDRCY